MLKRMHTACLAIAMVLLAGGCAGVPSGVLHPEQDSAQKRAEAELQDAKAEAAMLRAGLATARIAAAKQEAELRELRRQVNELQQLVDARQAELISLREERDRLTQSATIAQVQVANPSALPASAADVANLKATLHQMESALATLTAELVQVKKDVSESVAASKSKSAPAKAARPRSP